MTCQSSEPEQMTQSEQVQQLLQQGNEQSDRGQYLAAFESFQQATELNPHNAEAWYGLGLACYWLERYQEAVEHLTRSIELKPNYILAISRRGLAYQDLNQSDRANTDFEQALQFEPCDAADWQGRGIALNRLKRCEEAIASYDKALEVKPDDYSAWRNRGIALRNLGRYEEAIASFDKALEVKSDDYSAWHNRGVALGNLGRYEEAIASYDKALEVKSDDYFAWHNRGVALGNLGRYEEAVASYDKALEVKPDEHRIWDSRGVALGNLGRYEEAVASYDKALEVKPEDYSTWFNRGIALFNLGRYEEAVASYDKVLEVKPDYHDAWLSRGIILCDDLRRYKEAIASFDKALELKPDYSNNWHNKGVAFLNSQGYKAAVAIWDQGIKTLLAFEPQTAQHKDGCGRLYYRKANTLYYYGKQQANPFPDWLEAHANYQKALEFIPLDQFPDQHLAIWQDFLALQYHLGDNAVKAALDEGAAKLDRILENSALSLGQKIALERKFSGFKQIRVDTLSSQDPTQALELAEAAKNRCLARLRNGWTAKTPALSYSEIQTLLSPRTAILYWHLSPVALTTFILKFDQPPQVLSPASPSLFERLLNPQKYATPTLQSQHLRRFETWMQRWKQAYQAHNPEAGTADLWRENMQIWLLELLDILEIERLCNDYLQDIDHLILIPHRDLHLLPLHSLFPRFTAIYLPSAQIGLDLHYNQTALTQQLLSIEDPATRHAKGKSGSPQKLLFAEIESAVIAQLYSTRAISGERATRDAVIAGIKTGSDRLHFTGHAYHDINEPQNSAFALAEDDLLTLQDLFDPNLHLESYYLVSLSACETGLTSSADIVDEYVGLVSGFLAAGVSYVISTLWTVDEVASALMMIKFHQLLRQSMHPKMALKSAQNWLRTIGYAELSPWYRALASEIAVKDPNCADVLNVLARNAEIAEQKQKNEIAEQKQKNAFPLYTDPYYWAGYTITGKV